MRNFVLSGDALVGWKLGRLGRSPKHLIKVVHSLHAASVDFRTVPKNLDTTTSDGLLVFHVFGTLTEFERDLMRTHRNPSEREA